jgi:uncharacterized membrane protein
MVRKRLSLAALLAAFAVWSVLLVISVGVLGLVER